MVKTVTVLGDTYKDVITGFQGVCIAKAQYLTGCDQSGLKLRSLDKDGKTPDAIWFDDTQLVKVARAKRIVIDTQAVAESNRRTGGPNSATPGKQG